ncbi:hypothetical protein R5R35_012307 [Gryllus longicercus]|uniref:Inositol-tetrakisphosphate 1-kinase n=1 Tax=Gryllus longicercus TaxID=2509291 RepID=A0AAN9V3F0_9ORTH
MCEKTQGNVIGYWMSEKKRQKLNWMEFGKVCRKHGYELVKLDLSLPLEDQGPFCLILHKLTDIIAQGEKGDVKAQEMIRRVEEYFRGHPEVAVLDPLDNVRKLLDRSISYSVIHNSSLEKTDVFTPTFVELVSNDYVENLRKLKQAGISFPFVCKPSFAHGSSQAHQMCVMFNEAGVRDCRPPCVAQSFINHNAVLYKIYIVGEQHYVVERPSLKNFYPSDHPTISFDAHQVSKPDSKSSLSILDPEDAALPTLKPDPDRLTLIASTVRQALGMSLLGVDVVVENSTGKLAIIDINAYPGYDGYPDFFDHLIACITQTLSEHDASAPTVSSYSSQSSSSSSPNKISSLDDFAKPNRIAHFASGATCDQDDSGFDTGDSSDEKKKQREQQVARQRVTVSRK